MAAGDAAEGFADGRPQLLGPAVCSGRRRSALRAALRGAAAALVEARIARKMGISPANMGDFQG